MIIYNNTNNQDIALYVRDDAGGDQFIKLPPRHFIYTPTDEKTRSVNFHGLKKNIGVEFGTQKPEFAQYFIPYTKEFIDKKKEEEKQKKQKNEENEENEKKEECSSFSNSHSNENANDLISSKEIENSYNPYEELYLNSLKEDKENNDKEEKEDEEKRNKKNSSPRKKGPGRPRKPGRKPKPKKPGRPRKRGPKPKNRKNNK